MLRLFAIAVLVAFVSSTSAQTPSVMGLWLTASKTAQVQIGPCADAARGPICGVIAGLIEPKGPDGKIVAPEQAVDFRNTDPALRERKIMGLTLIYDFKKGSEPNAFEEGTIYNATNGKTYKANLSLQPDGTLRLRGYVGSPMFGETQIWTRVQ